MGILSLPDDISLSYMNYHLILRCVVLIFVLDHQSFPGIVVSFILALPSKSHLVPHKVGFILDNFHKLHPAEQKLTIAVPHRPAGPVVLGEKAIIAF